MSEGNEFEYASSSASSTIVGGDISTPDIKSMEPMVAQARISEWVPEEARQWFVESTTSMNAFLDVVDNLNFTRGEEDLSGLDAEMGLLDIGSPCLSVNSDHEFLPCLNHQNKEWKAELAPLRPCDVLGMLSPTCCVDLDIGPPAQNESLERSDPATVTTKTTTETRTVSRTFSGQKSPVLGHSAASSPTLPSSESWTLIRPIKSEVVVGKRRRSEEQEPIGTPGETEGYSLTK